MHLTTLIILNLLVFVYPIMGQPNQDQWVSRTKPALLPAPQSVVWKNASIDISEVKITLPQFPTKSAQQTQLIKELKNILSRNSIKYSKTASKSILFQIGHINCPETWKGQTAEAYHLIVTNQGITITAKNLTGFYHSIQTLRQLIVSKDNKPSIAVCEITDYPAFKIRGFMIDVGRNYLPLNLIKRQIDCMARYKMNVFHWHLTDNHGWRLESKIYPQLQSQSSFSRHQGKFYTQNEFNEILNYCHARGITLIPELDSPGHSEAFRRGLGIKTMKDPKAKEAMCHLIDELCSLDRGNIMPYIHLGTDEVRHAEEYVNDNYLPALHKAVEKNGKTVIGWWKGQTFPNSKQIYQTWAQNPPVKGSPHIDSRANYINHLEALDFTTRLHFQQPCRVTFGNEQQLGGILCHWPDTLISNPDLCFTNNPVLPATVAYSEAVWKGIAKDLAEYWATVPQKGTPAFASLADLESRLAEQRDRFFSQQPFPFVKSHNIQWRLLGPISDGAVQALEKGKVEESYHTNNQTLNWGQPLQGGAIHINHFFGFQSHLPKIPHNKIVWASTHIYSPKKQTIEAWINFNTISSSDNRAGSATANHWGANPACKVWINSTPITPPQWINNGKLGSEIPLIDQVYTSRPTTKIQLNKGWNTVLIKTAPKWKWSFTFCPVQSNGINFREMDELKFSAYQPQAR